MEVTGLEAIPVEVGVTPLGESDGIAPYTTNHGAVTEKVRMLIRVDTDAGVTGWGEMRTTFSPESTKVTLEHDVAPALIGRNVWEMASLAEEFFYEYQDIDTYLGGVEIALWDALGKGLGAPVHELIGGKATDAVDVAYCVGILDPEDSRPHARKALAEGYSVLKTKAGRDWKQDVERIVAMDEEVDGALDFRLDPNQGWTTEDAVRVGARLEDAGVYLQYLEQPVRIDSYGTYKRLRERLRQPVGVNEDMYYARNLLHLAREDAIDVGVLDMIPAGGITGLQRLAAVGADLGISMTHHCAFDLGIKTAAVLHAVAATPAINLPPDTVYYAWEDDVIEEPFAVKDGAIAVPDGPGLGVTVDEDAVEAHRITLDL